MDLPSRIFWQKCAEFIQGRGFIFFLIATGVVLRLKYYSENLSLWLDEAALTLEILRRSFSEIFFVANYNQSSPTAPVGFLLLEKGAIACLGSAEWALRLIPLVCSVFSVFLFLPLARKYVRVGAVPLALALFALAGPLIYYSAQVKPYSCDVLVAIFVLWGAAHVRDMRPGLGRTIMVGGIAATTIWVSYGALFVVSGTLMILVISALLEKQGKKIIFIFGAACLAGASFWGIYVNELTQISNNSGLYWMWQEAFMPWPAGSWASIVWFKGAILSIFKDTLGQPLTLLAGVLFFTGIAAVFARNKENCFLLVTPAALALAAAGMHKYPFSGRFVLFLAPAAVLLMAEGTAYIVEKISRWPWAQALLIVTIFWHPVKNAADVAIHTHAFEEMRPVTSYLKEHYRDGDAVFLNNSAQYAYGYYGGRYRLAVGDLFVGVIVELRKPFQHFDPAIHAVYVNYERGDLGHFVGWRIGQPAKAFSKEAWEKIRYNKRTWVIFSHAPAAYRAIVLDYFNREGKKLEEVHSPGASIYLFDMGRP